MGDDVFILETRGDGTSMLKVAVCDDEKVFGEKLRSIISLYLQKKQISFRIDLYLSGMEFVRLDMEMAKYQIVFLDINMEQINGIETAMCLRRLCKETFLVFVTAYIDYTLEGYKVDAVRYILKNVGNLEETVFESLDAIWVKMAYKSYIKEFSFKNCVKRISLEHIVYIESNLHELFFHVLENELITYSMRNTLNRIEEELVKELFVRIHQSYLVNLKFIKNIKPRFVVLINGTELAIAKPRYKYVKERFTYYQGEF